MPEDEKPDDDATIGVMELDKMRNRRAMAWISFALIVLINVPMLVFGMTSDDMATRVDKMSYLLTMQTSIFTSIVFVYFGVSTFTDLRTKR